MTEINEEIDSENLIKNAHKFLLEKYQSRDQFTKDEFRRFTGWSESAFNTYFSKLFKPLLISNQENKFQVTDTFRRFSLYKKFRAYFSQSRRIRADYTKFRYDNVIIYEFFMPLTNEGNLRSTLDSLFYKDEIINRLKTVPIDKIKTLKIYFPLNKDEKEEDYYERICKWISDKFQGYSIGHFQGRFRVGDLKSFKEVVDVQKSSGGYIIDETTAIVKFIFPCGESGRSEKTDDLMQFLYEFDSEKNKGIVKKEANLLRILFNILFVDSILQTVSGEDEIWMLESGMESHLHIWKVI